MSGRVSPPGQSQVYTTRSLDPVLVESIVVFIDSLGSQAVARDRTLQQRRLEQLSTGIAAARKTAGLPSADGYCSTATFTDNIVIGFPIDKTGDPPLSDVDLTWAVYLRVLLAAASYQAELVRHGLFVRGGIATGPLWMNTNFVYGSGLIDAYKLEHEHAIYPRIIVSSHFVDIGKTLVGQLRSAESEAWLDNFLIHGRDGQYFINYLFDDRIQQAQRNDVVVAKTGYTGRRPPASMNWKSKTQSTATCLSTLTAAGSVPEAQEHQAPLIRSFRRHMRGRSDHGVQLSEWPVSHLPLLGSAGVGHGRNANDTWICRQLRGEPLTAAVNARVFLPNLWRPSSS